MSAAAEGKDSFLSDHVTSVIITGDDVESVIPAQSDVEVTLKFDENGGLPTCSVFFPDINWTHKVILEDVKTKNVDAKWVSQEIDKDIDRVTEFLEENNSTQLDKCLSRLEELKQDLKNNENNPSGRITVLNKVRENRREIENHISIDEWPKVSEELKSSFYKAEELIEKIDSGELDAENLNMDKVHTHLEEFRGKIEQIIRNKETIIAKEIISEINQLIMAMLDAIMPGMRERKFIEYIDDKGNNLICVPSSISFVPIHIPPATNNFNIGIEVWDRTKKIGVFRGLKGLEKNKPLKNAVGVISDIKTPKQLVPGKSENTLEIRIFQGEDNAEGKDSFLSDHVSELS